MVWTDKLLLELMERVKHLLSELPVMERVMQSALESLSNRNMTSIQIEGLFKLYCEMFQFYNTSLDLFRRCLLAVSPTVTIEEKELLNGYRMLNENKQKEVLQVIYGDRKD